MLENEIKSLESQLNRLYIVWQELEECGLVNQADEMACRAERLREHIEKLKDDLEGKY